MAGNSGHIIVPKQFAPSGDVLLRMENFISVFKPFEIENGGCLLVMFDKRSDAFYLNCHLDSKMVAAKSDLDAVLDPEESEEYRLNREIYTDTYAYRLMESDALNGRSFEDLVVEYDVTYRPERPLKVFGGQHRVKAIGEAIKKQVVVAHGVRVYFGLTNDQKVDIATANNTSIAVSNDLLDRMREDLLGSSLRDWCQAVGLLEKGRNFVDRRSPEGIPAVRIARTLLVDFYLGQKCDADDFAVPVVCSSGPGLDGDYERLRSTIDWKNAALHKMGSEFARLHKLQRQIVLNRDVDKHMEFANKAIHPCVVASWAFAAGLFQKDPQALQNHYALANSVSPQDPLNAKALSSARLKGVDPDTYRGLGARINNVELGRMLEVFVLQAMKAKERGITPKVANAAIKSYEAKRAKRDAEAAFKGI